MSEVGAQPNTFGIPGVDKYGRLTRATSGSGTLLRNYSDPSVELLQPQQSIHSPLVALVVLGATWKVSEGDRTRAAATKGQ